MDPQALSVIISFYDQVDVFMLIFVRVLAFFLLVPVISGASVPALAKLTLSICVTAVLFISGAADTVSYHDTMAGYVMLVISEFFTGMLMGYVLSFVFNIIFYTGQLIDYQIGLSMMSVLDPVTQIQVPVIGNLYYLAISALLVVTGGLHSFMEAFFYSFQIIPIGTSQVIGNAPLAYYVLMLLTEFLVLGVKIALPVVGAILVIDAVLGIMVKAVPQMNVFVVGMPVKLLIGLFLLITVMAPTIGIIHDSIFDRAYEALTEVMWGMAP